MTTAERLLAIQRRRRQIQELQREIDELARELRRDGVKRTRIARTMGLHYDTIQRRYG